MPQLGETVTEGTVTRWLHQIGDVVAEQEPLLEIATDKVDTEVPAPGAGRLLEILVGEDETVAVGTLLAIIGTLPQDETRSPSDPSRAAPATAAPAAAAAATAAPATAEPATAAAATAEPATAEPAAAEPATAEPAAAEPAAAEPARAEPVPAVSPISTAVHDHPRRWRQRHSPRVRRLAAETGVSLDGLTGTGTGGRICPADVLRAARKTAADPSESAAMYTGAGAAGSQAGSAASASCSAASVIEVDLTVLARAVAARSTAPSVLPALIAKSFLEGVRAWSGGNAGLASAAALSRLGVVKDPAGAPVVIEAAGDLNVAGLARRLESLPAADRVEPQRPEPAGLHLMLTRGALLEFMPVTAGQLCLLAVGELQERPAVIESTDGDKVLAIRTTSYLTLSYDPRIISRADAISLLAGLKSRLQSPDIVAELG